MASRGFLLSPFVIAVPLAICLFPRWFHPQAAAALLARLFALPVDAAPAAFGPHPPPTGAVRLGLAAAAIAPAIPAGPVLLVLLAPRGFERLVVRVRREEDPDGGNVAG